MFPALVVGQFLLVDCLFDEIAGKFDTTAMGEEEAYLSACKLGERSASEAERWLKTGDGLEPSERMPVHGFLWELCALEDVVLRGGGRCEVDVE